MVVCYDQAQSADVDKVKKMVSECVDVADKLQTSSVCSEIACIGLHKQMRELQLLAAEVDEDWCKKRSQLQTELSHHENYYTCYQVGPVFSGAYTISATNHIGHNHYHIGHKLYRIQSREDEDDGHALWPIWFVADMVEPPSMLQH